MRFENVLVRSVARLIGSASCLLAPGYLSTSSKNRKRIGLDANPLAEFEPVRLIYI